jgi:hypothetical protein
VNTRALVTSPRALSMDKKLRGEITFLTKKIHDYFHYRVSLNQICQLSQILVSWFGANTFKEFISMNFQFLFFPFL